MEIMRKIWPASFKTEKGNVSALVIKLLIFAAICALSGVLLGVLCGVPYVGVVLAVLCGCGALYGLGGIVLTVLYYTQVLKN